MGSLSLEHNVRTQAVRGAGPKAAFLITLEGRWLRRRLPRERLEGAASGDGNAFIRQRFPPSPVVELPPVGDAGTVQTLCSAGRAQQAAQAKA